jgi:hypothetical protein
VKAIVTVFTVINLAVGFVCLAIMGIIFGSLSMLWGK